MSAPNKGVSAASRAITDELKKEYSRIEDAKRRTMGRRRLKSQTAAWLKSLAERICQSNILTEELSVQEKFAVIFLINHLFHGGHSRAGKIKNYVQRTILLYHRDEIEMKEIPPGRPHGGTYEIKHGIWTTHLPKKVVEAGGLERPNKPSVIGALRPKVGLMRSTWSGLISALRWLFRLGRSR